MAKELNKVYEPQAVEAEIYKMWQEGGYFHAERDENKKPFTIVMPPPNVTGQLHMGHAMDATLQDSIIRFKRMQGYNALWIPGVDHAGIATQIKVEEELRKEGLTRYDLGREKFLERVWDWKNRFGNRIVEQQKKLGSSCDWDRARFTMDEGCSKAVREVFVSLYEKGLIYKGSRIINWCPHCVTALSDAEVEYVDKPGHLWHIRYPLEDGSGEVIVATTRPETMLGDSGVCVNPNDERYKAIVGKNVILPLLNKPIPVVADDYAEMEFGTGCVKMTPAHDPNDFEVGLRHNLEVIRVLDDEGKVNSLGGKYEGMDRYEARKAIVADLDAQGYLVKVEDYAHNVGTCYRCHNDVEPIISAQWFVKMKPLAEKAIDVVKEGETRFVPDRFTKTYLNWMENVRDWCISRQLWWGHQIPAWTCADCGHITVSREDACKCEKCGSTHIERDPDVLDTWFSSALWPFETLGWPEKTPDLDYFYPTDVLVTGYDIIFFWVARMIFSGCEHTGKAPFHTVLIHGLVRDDKGRKMSKSLGNGIDPLEMIDKYGCDALRMNMVTSNSPGNDMRFYVERCEAMRNFANKLWNASRYVLMNLGEDFVPQLPTELEIADKWVLSKLNTLIAEVTDNMERYELGIAVQKIYDFIWDTYCDWYIELTKARLYSEDASRKNTAMQVLVYVLDQTLRLLHPFMPFITEEIWQSLPMRESALIVAKWPEASEKLSFKTEEAHMESVMNAIRAIRNRRAEMNVPPSKKATLYVLTAASQVFTEGEGFIQRLAYADKVELLDKEPENLNGLVTCATADAKLYIPMGQLVDIAKEQERISKELDKARKNLAGLNGKLSNENFVSRAPEAVVNAEREKAKKAADLIAALEESLEALKAL
ncbi:valine--tRNA ligase [Pseudoflavonifractor sp. MSJ-30]|uniref:valine--tRNA ligase n=1 Tax=Pseudoflavonifractor sp. MSJ-30 TaxID=2841525 RepID=UPI001C1265BB|nr:valine--tRNA ligase [Pseudoflavonifractor sp. MSJ-30]MBU5453313.1 valine--tRNA ligase [Pseudoflavonifractor sp. MSJ-30]